MVEIESFFIKLKEKFVEVENVIFVLRDGKEMVIVIIIKMV